MKAISYWEVNAILISLEGSVLQLHEKPSNFKRNQFGQIKEGSSLLSYKEAKQLLESLKAAIKCFEGTEESVMEYFGAEEKT